MQTHPYAPDDHYSQWRQTLYRIIFEANTKSGKLFDLILIGCILMSVSIVILESVISIRQEYGFILYPLEWMFTILFTIEYILRILCIKKPLRYMLSFFGIVDLLSIIPTYLSLFVAGTHSLNVIRILRVLRVFRILKMTKHLGEAKLLMEALHASRQKITVFLFSVIAITIVMGAVMYVIEGEESGFTSIPRAIYWAVVTLTTVGYGDISPTTPLGQTIAAMIMILGYSIITVPTGILTVELSYRPVSSSTRACPACGKDGHDTDADFCKYCGHPL